VPTVLSTPDAEARVAGVRGLDPWERVTLAGPAGDVHVTAVPARHGPEGCEPVTGAVAGFVLEADGERTVYVSGDNASLDVVDAVSRRFDVGVAVLFVGRATVPGRFDGAPLTLDARLAAAAAEPLAPATIVPVHHTDWAHFQEPLSALVDRFEANGRSHRLVVVPHGATSEL
jgi:L-ascorbate metabolism protein UlaG (beta-lactamase superfamily)